MREPIFTIGHGSHDRETFLALLRIHGITLVVDVRSSPYSRYCPHFCQAPLRQALQAAGIGYLFLGEHLGGQPTAAEFYDQEGHVLYDRLAASAAFGEGLAAVRQHGATTRVALLCGEEDPRHCHRRLLIARVLGESGCQVWHIRGDGRLQSEAELAAGALAPGQQPALPGAAALAVGVREGKKFLRPALGTLHRIFWPPAPGEPSGTDPDALRAGPRCAGHLRGE